MKRLYHFWDMEDVYFDDNKTVKKLMQFVFDESDYYEPMGMDVVTVYDASKYYVVTDTSRKCKDELDPFGSNGLCVAYLKKGFFFFAEGGWGHHMIEMNAVEFISNPINVNVIFDNFNNFVVINGKIKLGEIYSYLVKTTYISIDESKFFIGTLINGLLDRDSEVKTYNMLSSDKDLSLQEVVDDNISPVLIIKR